MDSQEDRSAIFVDARSRLSVGDASAAIIILEDGRYLLQLRDDIELIWYPGHWGCFGGGGLLSLVKILLRHFGEKCGKNSRSK